MNGDDGFRFDDFTRRLFLLSHSEQTIKDLEALIQNERERAFDRGYAAGLRKAVAS
jgi:hypothetical protein